MGRRGGVLRDGMAPWRRAAGTAALSICLAAFGLLVLAAPGRAGASTPPEPAQDPFYDAPANLASDANGAVIASRAVTIGLYGALPESVRAWQVLYRTTDTQGDPEATVATIMEPKGAAPANRPLVSYQVAEDSLGSQCAPSYEFQEGAQSTNAVTQTELLIVDALLERGDAVVVSDYEGPNSAYAAGVQAGQAVLDGIRAAEQFAPDGLNASTPVGMWGYSGGALATMWAAELQPGYAPSVHLVGTAAGGVPVNVGNIPRKINGGPFAGYYLAGVVGLSRAYPQLASLLDQILTPAGKQAAAHVGTECNQQIVQDYAFENITDYTNVSDPLTQPVAERVLAADTLGQHRPAGPLYVYQAVPDELIPIADVDGLMARYCAEGVTVDYQRNLASEHLTLVGTGAFAALNWLEDRFAGQAAPSTCATGGETVISTALSLTTIVGFLTYLGGWGTLFGS